MTNLVLDVKPSQLVLSKNGALKVAFFDKMCKVNVKRDDKDRILSSDEVAKLFIHIEIPSDSTTVVIRPVKEVRITDGDDVRWLSETELYTRAYDKYLALKNAVVYNPEAENEELKKKLAEAEAKLAVKAQDIAELENAPKKGRKPAVKEEAKEEVTE
jgi:hypothetical protein